MVIRCIAVLLSCAGAFPVVAVGRELADLKPFLKKYCQECHGPEKQKGDYRFDTLTTDLAGTETLETWQGILDQLNLGEMPPKKNLQATEEEWSQVVEELTAQLSAFYAKQRSTGGHTVLRRLNRHELRNTFRDLLYLEGPEYRPGAAGSRLVDNNGNGSVERTGNDPLRFFPEDEEEDGFFNLGGQLVMSDFLLKLTLGAVEETLAQATHLGARPEARPHHFIGPLIKGKGGHLIETVSRELNAGYEMMAVGYERSGRLAPSELRGGVGLSTRYRITVEASGHNPRHPWNEMISVDAEDPFQLCLNIADTRNGGIGGVTSTPEALWSLPADGSRKVFTHEVWMDRTWTPWLGWENGPTDRIVRAEKIAEKYLPDRFYKRPDKKVDKGKHDSWPLDMARLLFKGGYPGPHLRIHSLKVEPLLDRWPPRSHTALYGTGSGEAEEIRKLMLAFARRCFRRPVEAKEVEPYVQLVLKHQAEPVVKVAGGLRKLSYRVYEGKWDKLPDFDSLPAVAKGDLPDGLIDIRAGKRKEYYGMVFEGMLEAPRAGEYVFEMASDDGARILVDGKEIVVHDGLHGPTLKKGKIRLESGEHDIRVEYFAYGGANSFRAGWSGSNSAHARLSVDSLHNAPRDNKPKNVVPPLVRAMQDGYAALMCSPQFLYLKEASGALDDFAIASRLSYFLWSSMPDETLLALARAGQLSDPAELDRQVDRMLRDPRAAAFIRHFPSTWLRLDKLGKMPPSGGDYQFYKNLRVEPMLMKQVTAYFAEILETNGRIEQFIDSDYTYMNQTLAKWIYRREGIRGERLRKVKLEDPRRGGLFTQPGVMTATANGVDTSPVIRGVWLLENVLGTPPSPPPPDIDPLPTDTREATTIRERLALHRKNKTCNSCHRKIDPMGFAFENFDVVGRWRDRYRRAREPIDTLVTLSNGTEIADIIGFKKMLMERKSLVVRCLTEKMLTYATGRRLEAIDRGVVDRITAELATRDNRLRELVRLVVKSEIFLKN
ncbi:MAG: DUF1592 domain-containing protein [Roseibacillus sp.]|jgi:cytochrome c553|nr:DUF1592 domain-containing protein [Roseibacillus sp.]HJM62993.1 DUF1592 domain-containing protein [Roseibacillus sp.]|tara:strand:- start:6034 stop:9039 length:3006 start_codon:yes stop_codon:yes gene_type:complete